MFKQSGMITVKVLTHPHLLNYKKFPCLPHDYDIYYTLACPKYTKVNLECMFQCALHLDVKTRQSS